MWHCKRQSGFTLIEVLLAIAIFAVISLASFSVFDGVIRSEEVSEKQMERLNNIQRALLVMERDFLQMAMRSIRIEGEEPSRDFIFADNGGFSSSAQAIAFVRSGWTNPGLLIPRSDLQSVAYRVEDNTLERLHTNFVDATVGEEPKRRELIGNVLSLELTYFYRNKWQQEVIKGQLPQAINVKIDVEDYGIIERKFIVADKPPPRRQQSNSDSENNPNSDGQEQGTGNNPNSGKQSSESQNNRSGGSKQ